MSDARPKSKKVWRIVLWCAGGCLTVVAIAALALVWWLGDDSDLIEQDRLAAAAGMVTSWDAWQEDVIDVERRAHLDELVRMIDDDEIVSWEYSDCPDDWDEDSRGEWGPFVDIQPGMEVPPSLLHWHANHIDSQRLAAFTDCIDAIGDRAQAWQKVRSFGDIELSLGARMHAMRLLGELVLVAPDASAKDAAMDRFWRFTRANSYPTSLVSHMVCLAMIGKGLQIAHQAEAWSPATVAVVQELLESTGQRCRRAWNQEWLQLRGLLADVWQRDSFGVMMPEGFGWLLPVSLRLDRATMLAYERACYELLSVSDAEMLRNIHERDEELRASANGLHRLMHPFLHELLPGVGGTILHHQRANLAMRVSLAHVGAEPWPIDPWDPQGGELRRIIDAGEVVGAYSIGDNGTDDGWENEDWVFWLVRELAPAGTTP